MEANPAFGIPDPDDELAKAIAASMENASEASKTSKIKAGNFEIEGELN